MLHAASISKSTDQIAIIGIGCAFPGGIESPDALWQFLSRGGDAVVEVPADRWNVDAVYDPTPGTPGKAITRSAGLLRDVASFDAGFFGISPREAAPMDPQQRLLLQVAWRALEDAGIPAESLAGSSTGVYIGVSHSDYHGIQQFGRRQIDVHAATGGALSIVANRLSHRLDLRGPSLAIDTACSSSLVALDAACTALLTGECEATMVGGVNVMLTPDVTITFSRASMLSPDGRCKAFDARANGYVRGEGAGIVILKLLSRALFDRDRIHAVIRGTAVNQDGHTSTITVPSCDAQIAMLRQACARAGVRPSHIGYVEAHGTGTAVGDPIEASAIGTVFGEGRTGEGACVIGSIKTNIGHLEPAAGIAGLIKAALCVRQGEIPPSLHFERPNPHVDFDGLGIRVQRKLGAWPSGHRSRIAAVNSFGFGGTNACAIVEQPPQLAEPIFDDASPDWRPTLVPVSAASKTALTTACAQLADRLEARPCAFPDVAGTLALRRSHLDHRLVVAAQSAEAAVSALRAVAAGETSDAVISGRRTSGRRLAFVFTGQGAQWWGMGRGLLRQDPLFRETVERCDQLFSQRSGWSLLDELARPEDCSRINETVVAQPAIFALQVALAERLAAWGIRPEAVVGHSIGEIAAAHVAGALSLPQAVDVVYHRSRLQERARRQGGMAAVGLAAGRVRNYLEKFDGQLEVAAINGPELVSIAGPRALLDQFIAEVGREQADVLCQILRVDYAFHSHQMDAFTGELGDSLRGLRSQAVAVPMFSSVTGENIDGEGLDADYWCSNMRQPVLFKRAIDEAIDAGFDTFLELGAHPSLITPIRACLAGHNREGLALGTLHRERPDTEFDRLGRRVAARARSPDRLGRDHPAELDVRGAARPSLGEAGSLGGIGGEPRGAPRRPGASAARVPSQIHRADLAVRDRRELSALSSRPPHRRRGLVPGSRLCRADARGRTSSAGRRAPRSRGDFLSRGIVSQRRNVDADRNLARPSPRNRPGAQPTARRRNRLGLARNRARSTLGGSRISDRSVDAEDRAAAASGPRAFLPRSGQGRTHLRPGIPGRRNDLVCGGLRARQDRGAGIDHRCGQIHPSPRCARRLPAGHPWPACLRRRCAARRGRHDPVCH